MANQFGFQMSEDFLRGYAEYLKQLREDNPGKTYKVTLTVGLIPDGIGYEISVPPQITIDEEEGERDLDAEIRHVQETALTDAEVDKRIEEEPY